MVETEMYHYEANGVNFIIHKEHKYVAKVDLGNGRYRYFYDMDEYDRYMQNQSGHEGENLVDQAFKVTNNGTGGISRDTSDRIANDRFNRRDANFFSSLFDSNIKVDGKTYYSREGRLTKKGREIKEGVSGAVEKGAKFFQNLLGR